MDKIKLFSNLIQLIGVVLLVIGFWLGISFSISGGSLILVMLVLNRIINQTFEELQDLKDEIHSLRKKVESLKK